MLCSDAVFVRRAHLDVIGTLPTAQEARDFIQNKNANKRLVLVNQLLEREEFTDYWAMKWSDLLRVKAEFPINLWPNAAQAYYLWIRTSIWENKPYDRFVRELLTSSGSNFRVPPVNFYRAMQNKEADGIATTVALTFLGSRAEFWPKHYLPGMKAFFSQIGYKATSEWKEEIVFWDPSKAITRVTNSASEESANRLAQVAVFPDGTQITLPTETDPREVFANWLITPENPWFGLNIVNRVWSWLLGRGVIHEPDDIRSNNPARNHELLEYLKRELIAHRYDLKHIYRLILTSRAYQVSSMPKLNIPAEGSFLRYPVRRMEAEVLIDAICQITGTSELYTSAIPEPFTVIPEGMRSIALPDGSINSPFLELFGRPPRDTGMESERVNRTLPSQRLHMLNSSHILRKIEESSRLRAVMDGKRQQPQEIVRELYLKVLSRFPTNEELNAVSAYTNSGVVKSREVFVDLVWALMNTPEFLYRH